MKRFLFRLVVILVAGGFLYWQKDRLIPLGAGGGSDTSHQSGTVGPYEKMTGCRLVPNDSNDGDSFHVIHNGKEFHLRLYFVDSPETYLSDRHESQRRRVEEQAREMGGLDLDEAVQVGRAAKEFTRTKLSGKTFDVYTYWERVFDSDRFYGFVVLPDSGEFLGTELVKNGLARIHTKGPGSKENPVPTPRGKSFYQHRDSLYEWERTAQGSSLGAWGM